MKEFKYLIHVNIGKMCFLVFKNGAKLCLAQFNNILHNEIKKIFQFGGCLFLFLMKFGYN